MIRKSSRSSRDFGQKLIGQFSLCLVIIVSIFALVLGVCFVRSAKQASLFSFNVGMVPEDIVDTFDTLGISVNYPQPTATAGTSGNTSSSTTGVTRPASSDPDSASDSENFDSASTSGISTVADDLYYFASVMNEQDRQNYELVYQAMLNREEEVEIQSDDPDMSSRLAIAVLNDHPEIFWTQTSWEVKQAVGSDLQILKPDYLVSAKDQTKIQKQVDEKLEEALSSIHGSNEYQKAKAAFEYVIDHVEYDLNAPDNQVLHSALVNGKTVCAGYAKELQYLLQNMGIQAVYASGTVFPGSPHAWVVARINGEYYQMDPTNGDLNSVTGISSSTPAVDYDYFMQPDSTMMRSRQYDLLGWDYPACTNEQYKADKNLS